MMIFVINMNWFKLQSRRQSPTDWICLGLKICCSVQDAHGNLTIPEADEGPGSDSACTAIAAQIAGACKRKRTAIPGADSIGLSAESIYRDKGLCDYKRKRLREQIRELGILCTSLQPSSKINEAKLTEFQEETDKFMISVGKSNPFFLKLLLQKKNYLW